MVNPYSRKALVKRMRKLQFNIKAYFSDVEHWNNSVRKPDEEEIPPDPDGQLTAMLKALDDGLRREDVKGI
jgi:hypothetical protein